MKIIIIDSGIDRYSSAFSRIVESYAVVCNDREVKIIQDISKDYIGHGSAVSQIIVTENPNIDIISFRICKDQMEIDENILINVLKYIELYLEADIINISAGITYSYNSDELEKICKRLYDKNILIVAAFDNEGAISYPAMFKEVVGVDTTRSYDQKTDIITSNSGIVNVWVPDIFYRTVYLGKNTLLKGTSFACAKITGMLSRQYQKTIDINLKNVLDLISTKRQINHNSMETRKPDFLIKKAIIFPVNKESQALLKFSDLLSFEIKGVYDEKFAGRVGEVIEKHTVYSYDQIKWDEDFDTVILSCSRQLSKLTKRDYAKDIVALAEKYQKNIYSFESIECSNEKFFYPTMTKQLTPGENCGKLHRITIPVVGVWGTSSKQGKYTLQLNLIRELRKRGYNTGHISTEPSGYLFNADYVFHYGYNAEILVEPWECVSILNQYLWNIQKMNKDIIIVGSQSGMIQYDNVFVEPFFIYQHAIMTGINADFNVLCVNPHDELSYVNKTINFIDSLTIAGIQALVIFPIQAIETITGIGYGTKMLTKEELEKLKNEYADNFRVPVYISGDASDMNKLCDQIICFFSEEE